MKICPELTPVPNHSMEDSTEVFMVFLEMVLYDEMSGKQCL